MGWPLQARVLHMDLIEVVSIMKVAANILIVLLTALGPVHHHHHQVMHKHTPAQAQVEVQA